MRLYKFTDDSEGISNYWDGIFDEHKATGLGTEVAQGLKNLKSGERYWIGRKKFIKFISEIDN